MSGLSRFRFASVVVLACVLSVPAYGSVITSGASGDWSSTATWSGGSVPTSTDEVRITAGHQVTVTDIRSAARVLFNATGGGKLKIDPTGRLTLTGSVFDVTAPTTGSDSSIVSVEGGTLVVSATTVTISSSAANVAKLEISGTGGTVQIAGDLSFTGSASNSQVHLYDGTLELGGNLGSGGTFSMETAGTALLKLTGGSAQLLHNYDLARLKVQKDSAAAASIDGATNVSGSFELASGTFNNSYQPLTVGGSFSIAAGATFNHNGGVITLRGDFTNNGTFNTGLSTEIVRLEGATPTPVAQHVNGVATNFNILVVDNTAGVDLFTDLAANGLNLVNGVVFVDTGKVVDVANTLNRTNGYVDGWLIFRSIWAASPITFPVGTELAGYTPITVTVSDPPSGTTGLKVQAVEQFPGAGTGQNALKLYWEVESAGPPSTDVVTADLSFQWNPSVVYGDEFQYMLGQFNGGAWFRYGGVSAGTHSAAISGTSTPMSLWTAGQPGSLGVPSKLLIYSVNGGSPVTAGQAFPVEVRSTYDDTGLWAVLPASVDFTLSRGSGTGTLGGTLTGSIASGNDATTVTGVIYPVVENGVTIVATRTSGYSLSDATSAPFQVVAPPSSVSVSNLNDSGTGSLRQAILDANSGTCPSPCTILFDGLVTGGAINLVTNLPVITAAGLVIDGWTAPGAVQNSNAFGDPSNAVIAVEIDGAGVPDSPVPVGLDVQASNVEIRGLGVKNFTTGAAGSGISVTGANVAKVRGCYVGTNAAGTSSAPNYTGISVTGSSGVVVGGLGAEDRMVVAGNTDRNVSFESSGDIFGAYVGAKADLTGALGGSHGIVTGISGVVNVGHGSGIGNVVVGHSGDGITLKTSSCVVQGNYVGLLPDGTSAGNGYGIQIYKSDSNVVGGSVLEQRNVIGANTNFGITVRGDLNLIDGNVIGAAPDGETFLPRPNGNGIGLYDEAGDPSSQNGIGTRAGNTIIHNSGKGVVLPTTGIGNVIRGNVIAYNGGHPIDLGGENATPNDSADADSGQANNYQNSPFNLAGRLDGGAIEVKLSLDSASAVGTTHYVFDVYGLDGQSPAGMATYLGGSGCMAGKSFTGLVFWVSSQGLATGATIGATATAYANSDCSTVSEGTSELSAGEVIGGPIHWASPVSGSWETAANWNPPIVPGPQDTAVIDAAGSYTVTLGTSRSLFNLEVGRTPADGVQTLFIGAGGSLAVANMAQVYAGSVLNMAGTSLGGFGTIQIDGSFVWSAGTLTGWAPLNVHPGATASLTGAGTKTIAQRMFTVSSGATVSWTGGDIALTDGGGIQNSGTFDIETDGTLGNDGTGAGFVNYGPVTKKSSLGTTVFDGVQLEHYASTLSVQSGTFDPGNGYIGSAIQLAAGTELLINSDTFSLASGSAFSGSGTIRVTAGTLSVDENLLLPKLVLSGGEVGGYGTINTGGSGLVEWTGGVFSGGVLEVAAGGTLSMSGGAAKNLDRELRVLAGGTARIDDLGDLAISSAGAVVNGGLFEITDDANIRVSLSGPSAAGPVAQMGGSGSISNSGTLRKSTTAGVTQIDVFLENSGTIQVQSGTLDVAGVWNGATSPLVGTIDLTGNLVINDEAVTLAADSAVTGSGIVFVDGGSLEVNDDVTIPHLRFLSGFVSGSGVLTTPDIQWHDGSMGGSGTTLVPGGGTFQFASTGYKHIGRLISILGGATAEVTGSGWLKFEAGGSIENSGTFVVNVLPRFYNYGGSGPFVNQAGGILRKAADNGTVVFEGVTLENAGTIDVFNGTLEIGEGSNTGTIAVNAPAFLHLNGAGTTFTLNAGTAVTGAGQLELLDGTLAIGAPVSIPNFLQEGGILGGSGTATFSGAAVWNAGTWAGGGMTEVAPGATLTIGGPLDKYLDGRSINVAGAGTLTSSGTGWLHFQNGGSLQNNGTVEFTSVTPTTWANGGAAGSITNYATFRKATSAEIGIGPNFMNSGAGLIDVGVGPLVFAGTFSITTGTTRFTLAGKPAGQFGQLVFTGATPLFGGTLDVQLSAFSPVGGDAFRLVDIQTGGGAHNGEFFTNNYAALPGGRTFSRAWDTYGLLLSVDGPADLSIAKTGPSSVLLGEWFEYALTVSNPVPDLANGVTVTDTLPSGHTGINAYGSGWNCNVVGSSVTCNAMDPLGQGEAPAITVSANAPTVAGSLTNTATVSSSNDPNSANNSGSKLVNFTAGQADLELSGTNPAGPQPPSTAVSFLYGVTNHGPQPATSVHFSAVLPDGVNFGSISSPGATCGISGATVSCDWSSLAVSTTATVTLQVTPVTAGTKHLFGEVGAFEADPDAWLNTLDLEIGVTGGTVVVGNTGDKGTGSLRQALLDAASGVCTAPCNINFNITGTPPFVITPATDLPALASGAKINGGSQPGYSATPLIRIQGTPPGPAAGGPSVEAMLASPLLTLSGNGSTVDALSLTDGGDAAIYISGNSNVVKRCWIGLTPGNSAAPNLLGVRIEGSDNIVGGTSAADANIIAWNSERGLTVDIGTANQIIGNSFYANVGLGIDLMNGGVSGATANDLDDLDTGGNDLQNFPVITSANISGSDLVLSLSLDSTGNGTRIEAFFADNDGEGKTLLGSQCFSGADFTGQSMTVPKGPILAGDKIVATATTFQSGGCNTVLAGTSEFSTTSTVSGCAPLTITAPPSMCGLSAATASVPDAGVGATYAWSITGGTLIGDTTGRTVAFKANSSGTVQLSATVTTIAGCSSGTRAVPVNNNPTPYPTITGTPAWCANTSGYGATASYVTGLTYEWSITNGTIDSGQGTASIQFTTGATSPTVVRLLVTNASGCSRLWTDSFSPDDATEGPQAAGAAVEKRVLSAAGEGGTAWVTTGCSWTASSSAAWLTLSGTTSGTGDGTFTYAASANPSSTSRTATLTVAGIEIPVIQRGTGGTDGEGLAVTHFSGRDLFSGYREGTGTASRFTLPLGMVSDSAGNVFVADSRNHVIRKLNPATGVTTLFAGSPGSSGYRDGTGTDARFTNPSYLAIDSSDNLYVSEGAGISKVKNNTIRRITPAGAVTTVAGKAGAAGTADGTGSNARFNSPQGLTVGPDGHLYVADSYNCLIRKVTLPGGTVSTVAGIFNSWWPVDGPPGTGSFEQVSGIAADPAGNLYVVESSTYTVRKIDTAGNISTLAGLLNTQGYVDDPIGANARFAGFTWSIVYSGGFLYVPDGGNARIRKVALNGAVTTVAGGNSSQVDGTAGGAGFGTSLNGIGADSSGNLYVADGPRIRRVNASAVVDTIAGPPLPDPLASRDGNASTAILAQGQLAVDSGGNVYVAETRCIRRIDPAGNVTTWAGDCGATASFLDGPLASARFKSIGDIAFNPAGDLYVSDDYTIRRISGGTVTTVAGIQGVSIHLDGSGKLAGFVSTPGLVSDGAGDIYAADKTLIRRMTPGGNVSTIAGRFNISAWADGNGTSALFANAHDLAFGTDGALRVVDDSSGSGGFNGTIRRVTTAGAVTTIAGLPSQWGSTDGAGGTARLWGHSITSAGSGAFYVTDLRHGTIRKLLPDDSMVTLAGLPETNGVDAGNASSARLTPGGIAVGPDGRIYVSEGLVSVASPNWQAAGAVVSGDAAICAGSSTTISATLSGTAPWSVTWSDSVVQSGISVSPVTRNVTPASTTVYTVTSISDAHGAGNASGSATITVNPVPNAALTAPSSVCFPTTSHVASVAYQPAATYVWNLSNATIDGGAGTNQITWTPLSAGTVTIGVTVTLGSCSSSDSRIVTVNPLPDATITAASSTCTLSTGNSASVPVQAGATYAWSITNGSITSAADTSSITFTAGSSGNVTLGVTVTLAGCSSSSTKIVGISANPTTTITAPSAVCAGSTGNAASVPAQTGATYAWIVTNGTVTGGAGTNAITFTAGAAGSVVVDVTVTAASCTSTGSVTIPAGAPPSVTITGPVTTCPSASFTLDAGPGFASYLWNTGATTQTITPSSAGTYSVTVTAGGCSASDSHVVTLAGNPSANISAPSSATEKQQGLTASVADQSGATYQWSITNGTIVSGASTRAIVFTAGSAGTTKLAVTVTVGGCSASDTHNVSVGAAVVDADLSVTKSAPPSVETGATLVYTIVVSNAGPATANNITVDDAIPAGVTVTAISGGGLDCALLDAGVRCTGSLAAGGSRTVTITTKAPAKAGTVTNTVTAAATSPDPSTANNGATASTNVVAPAVQCPSDPPSLVAPAAGAAVDSPVSFSWSAVTGATGYELWTVSPEATTLAGSTTGTSLQRALTSGSWSWFVVARLGEGCNPLTSTPRTFTVKAADTCGTHVAAQITAPASGAVLSSPVNVSWTPVPQAIGYRVWVSSNGSALEDAGTTDGAINFAVNPPAGAVAVYVDALFSGCPPTRSAAVLFTVQAPDPCAGRAPAQLVAPSNGVTLPASLTAFDWNAVTGADGYRVWISAAGDTPVVLGITTDETSLTANLPTGSVEWWVESLFDGCASTDSEKRGVVVPAKADCSGNAPQPVSPAAGATVSNALVTFSWNGVSGATAYELYVALEGGTPVLSGSTALTTLTASVPEGTIQWFVRAVLDRCPPVDSAHVSFTYAPPPDCAANRRAVAVTPSDGATVNSPVTFSWSRPDGATKFELFTVRGSGAPSLAGTTTATSLPGVVIPDGTLRWFVRTHYATSCPPLDSAEQRLTVVQPPPPCGTLASPVIAAPARISSGVPFNVQWNEVNGATSYQLQLAGSGSFTNPDTITTTQTVYQVVRTNNGSEPVALYARARAIDSRCIPPGVSAYGPKSAIYILPDLGDDGSTPETGGIVTFTLFLGPELAGQSFVAEPQETWLTVQPRSGVVGPDGTTLVVTANTAGLQVGTSLGSVAVTITAAASSGGVAGQGTTVLNPSFSVSIVTPISPTPKSTPPPDALIIPAVAHASGNGGSQFQSDVRVSNTSPALMTYELTFTPSGETGITEGKQTTFSVEPGATIALDDILNSWFGTGAASAFGSLEVRPLTQTATDTTSAAIQGLSNLVTFASSRTFNVSSNGTFGQFIPAIPFSNFVGAPLPGQPSTVLSLQQIAESMMYRTNLGLVEGSGEPATLSVRVYGESGQLMTTFPVSLTGGQHLQINSFLAQQGIQSLDDGRVEVEVTSAGGKVTAYASVLDNTTSDPLLVNPVAISDNGVSRWVVPGVADVQNGFANWQTDVRVFNAGTAPVDATMTFYPMGGGAPSATQVTIPAGQVQQFDRPLQNVFGLTGQAGALHIETAAPQRLVATARTYNETTHGTYGQFIPAVTALDAASVGSRPLQLLQVEESGRFRSNIGLVEVTGSPVTVELSVVPPDGKVTAVAELTLAGNEFRQIGSMLASFGFGDTYNARVTVRAVSGSGRVAAYASVIDAFTNDPTYVPAQ